VASGRRSSSTSPANIKTALLGDYANARFSIRVNVADFSKRILVDNIRFAGDITKRQTFHVRGSQQHAVTTNPLFSFDTVSNWSSSVGVSASTNKTQGMGSIGVAAANTTTLISRPFSTTELVGVTRKLSIDVFVLKPQPNAYWNGTISLSTTCGGLTNAYIGQASLTNRFENEFNTAEFTLPDSASVTCNGKPAEEQNLAGKRFKILDNAGSLSFSDDACDYPLKVQGNTALAAVDSCIPKGGAGSAIKIVRQTLESADGKLGKVTFEASFSAPLKQVAGGMQCTVTSESVARRL